MEEKGSDRLLESIRHLERKLGVLEEGKFYCCGVSLAQCHALVEVGRAGALSLMELASMLNLDTSTMSRTVERLVKGKFVKREADAQDRRYVRIFLTDKGKELHAYIEDQMKEYYNQVFADIPEEKRAQVLESLEIVVNAISIEGCCRGRAKGGFKGI